MAGLDEHVAPHRLGGEITHGGERPFDERRGDSEVQRSTEHGPRIEERARGRRVGIKVIDHPVDPHRLRHLAREAQVRRSVAAGVSIYDAVPDSYRRAIADA